MKINIPINHNNVFKIILGLIAIEILFVAFYSLDFISQHPYWQFCELFDLDREANIPTWFSTLQLLFIGLCALVVGGSSSPTLPPSKTFFTTIGLGFIYLSCDEASAIHEKITYAFYDNPLVPYFEGLHGVWIVVYGSIGILLALFFFRDFIALWKMFRPQAFLFITGVIVYLIGAAGAETITFFHVDKSNPVVYTIEVIIEEFFEMAGASLLLGSMLMLALKKSN